MLSLVIPAHGPTLGPALEAARAIRTALPYRVQVIVALDPRGTDGSLERDVCVDCDLIYSLRPGRGAALRAGMLAALGSYRLLLDPSWTGPAEQALMLLPPATTGFDVVIGSRHLAASLRQGEPRRAYLVGRAYNRLARALVVPDISDTQCGLKLFTAAAAEQIFTRTRETGWAVDVEALVLARALGLRVAQVPIDTHFVPGQAPHPLADGPDMIAALLRIRARGGPPRAISA